MTSHVLLAVFAHPDDELAAGGTLARCARAGVHTHLLCATRGEVGEAPSDLKGFGSVEFPVHARISIRQEIDLKSRAAEFHSSQLEGMGGARARWVERLFAADETFMRAVPADPPPRVERDLFEGIG